MCIYIYSVSSLKILYKFKKTLNILESQTYVPLDHWSMTQKHSDVSTFSLEVSQAHAKWWCYQKRVDKKPKENRWAQT